MMLLIQRKLKVPWNPTACIEQKLEKTETTQSISKFYNNLQNVYNITDFINNLEKFLYMWKWKTFL